MAGYSSTPLIKKLGIKPGMKLLIIDMPDDYFNWLQEDISAVVVKSGEHADMVHLFVKNRKQLEKHFASLIQLVPPAAAIWISWYKKSSGIATDVTEDVIRSVVLPRGWVDIKVCAVSNEWSGLKIVKKRS